jgi:anion-transporting  ArsA/GET3 family ATPase
MSELQSILNNCRLLVCVGSGGVGKTTTAASLALAGALAGRRTLVLTIDPARRLANSLGIQEFGNTEARIDLSSIGIQTAGELWAMMLDAPSTLKDVIRKVARDDSHRDAVLSNRIFQAISGSFSGSQEYMATERLYDVYTSGRYDLIVLDTPPVKNALDFLESPGKLVRFLDRQIMKWFLTPYEEEKVFSKRLLMGTSVVVYRLLGHIFGREFLDELSVFFTLFRDFYDGFRERHEAVSQIFTAPTTRFLVVAAPTDPSVEVARFFLQELQLRSCPTAGIILNQVHQASQANFDIEALLGAEARSLDPEYADRVLARLSSAHRRLRDLSAMDQERVRELKNTAGKRLWLKTVPRLAGEVHDLKGLKKLHTHLL